MQGSVHEIVCIADSLYDIKAVKLKLENELNHIKVKSRIKDKSRIKNRNKVVVLDWQDLLPGLVQGIKLDLFSGVIFYFILVLVVAFSILNTFLMAILERTKEFGVMLALGVAPSRLLRLVLMESSCMTIVGVSIGTAAGVLITLWFQSHGINLEGASDILKEYGMSGIVYPKLSLISAFTGPVCVLFITLLAALYPALKVRKMTPVDALNKV